MRECCSSDWEPRRKRFLRLRDDQFRISQNWKDPATAINLYLATKETQGSSQLRNCAAGVSIFAQRDGLQATRISNAPVETLLRLWGSSHGPISGGFACAAEEKPKPVVPQQDLGRGSNVTNRTWWWCLNLGCLSPPPPPPAGPVALEECLVLPPLANPGFRRCLGCR